MENYHENANKDNQILNTEVISCIIFYLRVGKLTPMRQIWLTAFLK